MSHLEPEAPLSDRSPLLMRPVYSLSTHVFDLRPVSDCTGFVHRVCSELFPSSPKPDSESIRIDFSFQPIVISGAPFANLEAAGDTIYHTALSFAGIPFDEPGAAVASTVDDVAKPAIECIADSVPQRPLSLSDLRSFDQELPRGTCEHIFLRPSGFCSLTRHSNSRKSSGRGWQWKCLGRPRE